MTLRSRYLSPLDLEPCGIEVFSAADDVNWHHDGLSRRRGNSGEFFFIVFFGEAGWDPAWGGAFEYGARSLSGDGWMRAIAAPGEEGARS